LTTSACDHFSIQKNPRIAWSKGVSHVPQAKPESLQVVEGLKAAMLEAVQRFFDEHLQTSPEAKAPIVADRPLQLATAALLIEMTRADREIKTDEIDAVTRAVERTLGLSAEQTLHLVRLAEEEVKVSGSFREFARLIDERYTLEQKRRIVLLLWKVAYADAVLAGHEEYLVRKIANLIHLPLADFAAAKIRARDEFR
jgi:uncharacterized tellurite resistance protein B-like protein